MTNTTVFNELEVSKLRELLGVFFYERELKFKKLHNDAKLPEKAGKLEACYDICCVEDEDFIDFGVHNNGDTASYYIMNPGESKIFHTGLSCEIPDGQAMFLWDRSGMGAKKNIHRLAGVIDCTYRGEILVSLINLSKDVNIINAGDKIIQGHISLVIPGKPVWSDELSESWRGENGFGSTGQ